MKLEPLIACILSLAVIGTINGQSKLRSQNQSVETAPAITSEEKKQAQDFAHRFIQRMKEMRDVSPLMSEMFVTNFRSLLTEDGWWAGLVSLPFPLAKQLNEEERYRLYVTQFSLENLFKLYYAGKVPFDEENLKDSENLLPPKVIEYLKSSNPPTGEIKSPEDARRYLTILENTLKLMKEHLASNPPEETEQFKKNLAAFNEHLKDKGNPWGQPFVTSIGKEFFGYPKGTRLIKLEIPFHTGLVLVKENGQLKVLLAMSVIPPD